MGLTLAGAVWALNRLQFLVVALVLGFAPVGRRPAAEAAGSEGLRVTGAWFYASTLTGLIDALGIGLGLWLLDVPLVVPIMTLTFILGYIPMVGATIAGAVAVVVALASGGLATALGALVVVIAVQQLEGNVLSPLLLSRAISFPPVVTLLLTTSAAVVIGVLGMFLVVPIAGAAVAAVRAYRRTAAMAPPPVDDEPPPLEGEPVNA
jgi:putative heme transporter